MKETIIPQINVDLSNIIQQDKKLFGKMHHAISFGNTTDNATFICPVTTNVLHEFDLVRSCNIRVVATGDLAFYATILGKINASGQWCT